MPTVFVVCGPSGVGKSTIGAALAEALGVSFVEGDAYHSVESVSKMRAGVALTDADREPWLRRLRTDVVEASYRRGVGAVLACSALKRMYRDILRGVPLGCDTCAHGAAQQQTTRSTDGTAGSLTARSSVSDGRVFFVMLRCDADLIAERMRSRLHHFISPSLLASQLATQELLDRDAGEVGVMVDLSPTIEATVAKVRCEIACYGA